MDPMTSIGGRFVPPSAKDFSIRARRLHLLVGDPLQKTQEWLSRLYGFANAYELRQALKRPNCFGPYDEDLEDGGDERRHRLRLAIAYPRPSDPITAFRRHLVADMGLFASPDGHATRHAQMADQLAFFQGEKSASPYAIQGWSSQNEAVLYRTPQGEKVQKLLERMLDEPDGLKRAQRMRRLADAHPENPWVRAAVLDEELEVLATWTGREQAVETRLRYGRADHIVSQFRRLYGDQEHLAIATRLMVRSPFGGDAYGYALSLATAGKLAMVAGDHVDAVRKFRRLRRMDRVPRLVPEPITIDPMGVNRFLDVASLNAGRGTSRRRIRPSLDKPWNEATTWRIFCDFGARVAAGDVQAVRSRLADIVLLHGRKALRSDLAEVLVKADHLRVPFPYLSQLQAAQFFLAIENLLRYRQELVCAIIAVLKDRAVVRACKGAPDLKGEPGRRVEGVDLRAITARLERAIDSAWSRQPPL